MLNKTISLRCFIFSLALFSLCACVKEESGGRIKLLDESRLLLPAPDSLSYANSTGALETFYLVSEENSYVNKHIDSDPNFLFGEVHYYADLEYHIKIYRSNAMNIKYHVYATGATSGKLDYLKTEIRPNNGSNLFSYTVSWNAWDSSETLKRRQSFSHGDTTYQNVFWADEHGSNYMMQDEKGLVKFDFANETWYLVN